MKGQDMLVLVTSQPIGTMWVTKNSSLVKTRDGWKDSSPRTVGGSQFSDFQMAVIVQGAQLGWVFL